MSIRNEMNPKRELVLSRYSNIVDSFNRLRVSTPTVIFDTQLEYGKVLENWFEAKSTSATITHLSSEASVQLRVTGDLMSATRQSRRYFRYRPGKGQYILMTFGDIVSATAVQKFVGYGDASNGIFFKSDESGYYFVKRTNTSGVVVDTAVEQIAWNMDKMNGNGPSRITLDFTKVQILVMDLEWLGVGRVRCGFVVDGEIIYAHEFTQANVGTEVYMKTANLPIRYHIAASTNATGNNDLKQICASVMSEGGVDEPAGTALGADTGSALVALTSEQEVISIRPKTTFKGFPNRINIVPSSIEVFTEDATIHYHIIWGGETNSSAAGWTDISTAHSGVEYSAAGTDITGGMELHGGFVPAAASLGAFTGSPGVVEKAFRRSTPLALDIAGAHPTVANSLLSDQLGIIITPTADTDIGVTIQWIEEH